MAEAHPFQENSTYLIHSVLFCLLKLVYLLYFAFVHVMFDLSASIVSKCHPLGVQRGNTGAKVPHGVQRATREQVTQSPGAEARAAGPFSRPLSSDVLHTAQLSTDTHRSDWDKTGAAARTSPTATQRLPDSSLILLRVLLLLTALMSWIATNTTAEQLCWPESHTCTLFEIHILTSHSSDIGERWNASLLNNSCTCLLYTSPSPRDEKVSRMPSSA